jgi:SH3-like domain-containing protein
MSVKNLKFYFLAMFISLFIMSCGDDNNTDKKDNDATNTESDSENVSVNTQEETNVVCLWKAVSLKKEPNSKGKYVTTMYLGESGTTNGKTVTDSTGSKVRDYMKIKLGDGTEGWIQANLVAADVVPSAVKSDTKLYNRPDILAPSNKEFNTMQFVVVTETQGEWSKVKGKRPGDGWFSEGWVKSDHLTGSEADITVSILKERALSNSDKSKMIEELEDILDNADLSTSVFISNVRDILDELKLSNEESEVETSDEKDI